MWDLKQNIALFIVGMQAIAIIVFLILAIAEGKINRRFFNLV